MCVKWEFLGNLLGKSWEKVGRKNQRNRVIIVLSEMTSGQFWFFHFFFIM